MSRALQVACSQLKPPKNMAYIAAMTVSPCLVRAAGARLVFDAEFRRVGRVGAVVESHAHIGYFSFTP